MTPPLPDTAPTTTAAAPAAAHLPRELGLLPATALNMIDMVGIGPFVVLPLVMQLLGPYFMWAWIAGALLSVVDGLVWAELGAAHPEAGGSYRFLRLAYGEHTWGRLLSFLYVWQTLVQAPLVLASGSIGFAQYFGYLVPLTEWWQPKLVSGTVVLLLVALLYRRIGSVGRLGVTLWVGVLVLLLGLIGCGLWLGERAVPLLPTAADGAANWPGLLLAAALGQATVKTIYSYLGYYNVCHLGAEIKEPARVIPRAIFLSILGIAALYLLLNYSVARVLPWQVASQSEFIVSTFIEHLFGPGAAQIATALVLWVAFASLFAVLLGYSRIPYAAAADGEFLPVFARLHPTKHFPHVSLLVLGGLGFVFSLLFKLSEVISAILAMRILVQFVGQAVGLVLLRRRRGTAGLPFRMPLYPLPVVLAVGSWLLILWSTGPAFMLSGLAMIAAGVVVFLLWSRRRRRWPFATAAQPD
ncbi:APC family permease [Hymenobacter sp. B81]|uniref:APC family permease n=1 Tax=Hymenobacter sp. B81 TaxID=3344878 RepID=UPI0037DBF658